MFFLKKLILSIVLPPLGPIILLVAGLVLARYRRIFGIVLAGVSLTALLILSTPWMASFLMSSLQRYTPIDYPQLAQCQAIVVLGGGVYRDAPEYVGDTIGFVSLERLRYALHLNKLSGLPILATGGSPQGGFSEAQVMRQSAESDFGGIIQWIEERSVDTLSSARLSATLLNEQGIKRIALVSHAWHLPRAVLNFEAVGLTVIPAPMGFSGSSPDVWALLPSAIALAASSRALHEWLGILAGRLGLI
jgi:uncharacterized SAM-binding protein YcdF (DUF218 family)